jgi:cytochrome c oxidase subunit III
MNIPYAVGVRPDTGLYNARLAIWLFLASEAMLFGGLFSAYALIRSGSTVWPHHDMNIPLAAFNTAVLIASSMTMVLAWASLKTANWRAHRRYLVVTVVLALLFLGVKSTEYAEHLRRGEGPAHDVFFALYFTMTGLHVLHIVGGVIVMLYFLGPGAALWRRDAEQFTNRIESTGLYWHFVDMVWIFLFPLLYLL